MGGPSSGADSSQKRGKLVTVKGFVGGEKLGFLHDEKVKRILRDRYQIELDFNKLGSIEMVSGDIASLDYLWPSSQVAQEIYVQHHGKPLKAEVIFNSPIVLYSWEEVVGALSAKGFVVHSPDGYYTADLSQLITAIESGTKWADVGLPQLYGRMTIYSTDPTRSNSGNMFAGLLANIYNQGEVTDENALPGVLPKLQGFFDRLGYLEGSSEDIFRHYLEEGMGAKPLIVGYESQLIEFGIEHPESVNVLRDKVRIVYPQPTVWSSHPLIAITPNGQRLLAALQDKELQRLAWEEHGFRSGVVGAHNDPAVLKVIGIPRDVSSVMPMPNARVMQRIIEALAAAINAKGLAPGQ